MADDLITLSDIAVVNSRDDYDLDISTLFDSAPLVASLSAITSSHGDIHSYYRKTGAPVVGFRALNDGRDHDSTVRTHVTENLKILDCGFSIDVAHAGAMGPKGPATLIQMEAVSHMRAGFYALEVQFINGTIGGSADGFQGLANYPTLASDARVVNAGGTTDLTSVWLLRTGPNDVQLVTGQDGQITVGETTVQRVDGDTGHFFAYVTDIHAWYGMQLGNLWSIARIANLDAGSNSLTDDHIYAALEIFPSDRQPNLIVMNRRSKFQLRDSRTAVNATGAPAPIPDEVAGIPIIMTDAISNGETVLSG